MEQITVNIPNEDDFTTMVEKIIAKKFEEHKLEFDSKKDEQVLNRNQASSFLNISPPTLDKYTDNGIVKGYRLGGRPVYKKSELISSLQQVEVSKYSRR
jgi:hypothetical protein